MAVQSHKTKQKASVKRESQKAGLKSSNGLHAWPALISLFISRSAIEGECAREESRHRQTCSGLGGSDGGDGGDGGDVGDCLNEVGVNQEEREIWP